MEQHHLKMLTRGLLLVDVDVTRKVKDSLPVLYPLTTRLDAGSLLEVMVEAVECRCGMWSASHVACCMFLQHRDT